MEFEEINDPKSWERYFKSLLRYRYGQENVFDIPDQNQGDWGVECYTACGKVFQCYFPDGKHSVATLYKNQREKVHEDLKKLTEDNASIWQEIFDNQGIKVKFWILATPTFSNKLLAQYISKKTKEVREKKLSFIDNDFRVSVHTDDDYPLEKQTISSCFKQLRLDVEQISDDELAQWISENVGFLSDLFPKLEKLTGGNLEEINAQKLAISNLYLTYQNMLDVLKNDYPQIHLSVLDCVSARKNNLKQRIALIGKSKAPAELLADHINQLEKDLERVVPNVLGGTRTDMCYGVIASWLIECPLRF